jgi:Concanavalin A-like lectin/glucanases superfamily
VVEATPSDADPRLDRDFTISLWAEVPRDRAGAAGGLAAKFDPVSRTGFSLSAISSAGGYNGPGDELRVSFGIDAGGEPRWFDRGRPSPVSNYVSNSLTVFEGSLFAATSDAPEEADRGHVHRHLGETAWEDLGQVGTEGAHGVGPLIVHRDSLYAATWNYDWTRVHDQALEPCRVYRYDGPGRWEDCGQPGRSRRIFSLASFRGDLLAFGDDSGVCVHRGGAAWEQVAAFDAFAHPVTVHGGRLVLGMLQPATVRAFDGRNWSDLGNPIGDPERCDEIHSLVTFRGALHAGTWPLGRVARWDAGWGRWRQTGRLGDSTEVMALAVYNGKLYGAAIPRAEVFRCERDRSWTSLRRLFAPPGWRPVLVRNMSRPPDGDRRMREWTRVTSLTQHDGLLFASVGSCTSAAADAPADVRGTVHAFSAGVVATTPRTLEPGCRHIAAVRRGGTVSVYVDGREAATASGSVTGPVATDAPLRVGEDEAGRYAGAIDGFRAFERALEAREIGALAADGPPLTPRVVHYEEAGT